MSRPERPEHLLDGVTNADPTELWAVYAASLIKAEAYMDAIEAERDGAEKRFLRCVKTRKDLADECVAIEAERDEAVQLLRQCLRELSWYEAHDDLHAAIDRLLSRMEEPHE